MLITPPPPPLRILRGIPLLQSTHDRPKPDPNLKGRWKLWLVCTSGSCRYSVGRSFISHSTLPLLGIWCARNIFSKVDFDILSYSATKRGECQRQTMRTASKNFGNISGRWLRRRSPFPALTRVNWGLKIGPGGPVVSFTHLRPDGLGHDWRRRAVYTDRILFGYNGLEVTLSSYKPHPFLSGCCGRD